MLEKKEICIARQNGLAFFTKIGPTAIVNVAKLNFLLFCYTMCGISSWIHVSEYANGASNRYILQLTIASFFGHLLLLELSATGI